MIKMSEPIKKSKKISKFFFVIFLCIAAMIIYFSFQKQRKENLDHKENLKQIQNVECIWSEVKTVGNYDFTFSKVKIENKSFYMIQSKNAPNYFKVIGVKSNNI